MIDFSIKVKTAIGKVGLKPYLDVPYNWFLETTHAKVSGQMSFQTNDLIGNNS